METMPVTREPNPREVDVAIDYLHDKGTPAQREYLGYRYTGFTKEQAAKMSGITMYDVDEWASEDEHFKDIDSRLSWDRPLRVHVRREVLEHIFSRNLRIALDIDRKVLEKARDEWEELSRDELLYLMNIRKFYTAQELATIEKVLSGQSGVDFNIVALIQQVNNYAGKSS